MSLTLVARLRNARLERKPVREMEAGVQCLHWLERYRDARSSYADAINRRPYGEGVVEAEDAMAEAQLRFTAARKRMRLAGKFKRPFMGEAA